MSAVCAAFRCCFGAGLRVVLQVAAEGKVYGEAARQLLVAVFQECFFDVPALVFFFQHVLQAGGARLVADAGEVFNVFGLAEALAQVFFFFLALCEV